MVYLPTNGLPNIEEAEATDEVAEIYALQADVDSMNTMALDQIR